MSIRYYDEALVQKIQGWIKDPHMRVLSPQDSTRLFQMTGDMTNDRPLELPLIAISRRPDIEIVSTTKRPLTYDGAKIDGNCDESKQLNAIPIRLSYQLDIYSRYFAEADEYARNFLFNFINYPDLKIIIPYNNTNIEHDSTLLLESTISDNSDIPQRFIPGQFTRMTLNLFTDDAYMFSVPISKNWKVEADLHICEEGDHV